MSFADAVATLPDAVRLWVLWLTIMMVAAPLVLLIFGESRRAGAVILVANVAVAVAMHLLYARVGMVRLLGLPHLLIWGPLLVWLSGELRAVSWRIVPRVVAMIFALSIAVSLIFDAIDVVRWIYGDRGALTGAAG
ncbi:hypothetical protein ROJ8625_03414 [Roseivivax jejudonensis]|uniref:Uncharacterized protein n=1 Tax=Roseivivax jejudonensis TaxID=1529041 RepID=A0A1X7A0D7_9RHOB|nr:hypothetical protein [Roseivivax jejudonensis]SLN66960.1 hypothetical protein ROJ8625_03414 [Roseivivax jejudonensis]